MKRLLKIAFDIGISSAIPIFCWYILGLLVDKKLINVFSITYPLQNLSLMIISAFSVGANISKEKDKNRYAVFSGIISGIVISFIVFGLFIINIDSYLIFMNVDVDTYKVFSVFSIVSLFLYTSLSFILNKLYFEDKNKLANIYAIGFNLINISILSMLAYFLKNQMVISVITIISLVIFILCVYAKELNEIKRDLIKLKFKINILKCLLYDSVDLFSHFTFFLIYFFGFSNGFEFGSEYVVAITFCALLTDCQWDMVHAITTVAKIDLVQNKFNYRVQLKNAYILDIILISTVLIFLVILNCFYELNYEIVFTILFLDLITFIIFPLYIIKVYVVQLLHSPKIATGNEMISVTIRLICSFIVTPFCVIIGQLISTFYLLVSVNFIEKIYRKKLEKISE